MYVAILLLLRLVFLLRVSKVRLPGEVLTSEVSPLWMRLLDDEDAGSGILAIMLLLIALGVALEGDEQRLHGMKLAAADVLQRVGACSWCCSQG